MPGRANPYDDHVANGSAFLRNGQYSLAATEFEAAYLLKKDPSIALQLGRIYLRLHQAVDAQRHCSAYLRITRFVEPDPDRAAKAHDCVNQATQLIRSSTSAQNAMPAVKQLEHGRTHQSAPLRSQRLVSQSDPAAAPTEPVSLDFSTQGQRRVVSPSNQVEQSPLAEKTVPVEEVPTQQLTDPVVTLKFRSAMVSPLVAEDDQVNTKRKSPGPIEQERLTPLHKRWWLWSSAGAALASVAVGVTVAVLRPSAAIPERLDPLADVPAANQIVVTF